MNKEPTGDKEQYRENPYRENPYIIWQDFFKAYWTYRYNIPANKTVEDWAYHFNIPLNKTVVDWAYRYNIPLNKTEIIKKERKGDVTYEKILH